jgi:heat shock protein HslJ
MSGNRAGLAQLVEHLICNQGVTGSSPVAGTSFGGMMFRILALTLGLVLMTGSGIAGSASLQGTSWRLTGTPERTITFAAGGRVQGKGGCNRFFGRYTQEGSELRISDIGATRMACDKARMSAESEFFALLEAARTFSADGTTLTLFSAGKGVLARLGKD